MFVIIIFSWGFLGGHGLLSNPSLFAQASCNYCMFRVKFQRDIAMLRQMTWLGFEKGFIISWLCMLNTILGQWTPLKSQWSSRYLASSFRKELDWSIFHVPESSRQQICFQFNGITQKCSKVWWMWVFRSADLLQTGCIDSSIFIIFIFSSTTILIISRSWLVERDFRVCLVCILISYLARAIVFLCWFLLVPIFCLYDCWLSSLSSIHFEFDLKPLF